MPRNPYLATVDMRLRFDPTTNECHIYINGLRACNGLTTIVGTVPPNLRTAKTCPSCQAIATSQRPASSDSCDKS
jgi:hypothetical protein